MRRDAFPALDGDLCYLDTAASALKPKVVADATYQFELSDYANVHRSAYQLGYKASVAFDKARETCAHFIGANPERFVWVGGATAGINLIAHGFLKPILGKQDNIVLTIQEHHANWLPWWDVAKASGASVRVVPVGEDGVITVEDVLQYVDKNTKMVAISHVSNITGQVQPIKALCQKLPEHVYCCVDGAQAVAHIDVDVNDLGCDFYVASAHKMYGPSGIGFVAVSKRCFSLCRPYQTGGGMVLSVGHGEVVFQDGPVGLEAGTPHITGAIGLAAACDWLRDIGLSAIRAHELRLTDIALGCLRESFKNIKIFGHSQGDQTGVISFEMHGIHPHDIATILDEHQVAMRAGHHCAMPLMRHWQVPALTRLSFGIYNDQKDIDKMLQGLQRVVEIFGTHHADN